MNKPLAGVRIVDLSRAVAGSFGTMILGDLGAEVIKVEPPGGDNTRVISGPSHRGESFEYLAFNRSKKSVVLHLATKGGRDRRI